MKLELTATLPEDAVLNGKFTGGNKSYSRINTPKDWEGEDYILVNLSRTSGFEITRGKEEQR